MRPAVQNAKRAVAVLFLAAVMVFFGWVMAGAGYGVVGRWSSIGAAYAACGVLWIMAGPAMIVAGLWLLGSLGRSRTPLLIGGAAAVLAGAVLVVGVLTYVVPCSGPD